MKNLVRRIGRWCLVRKATYPLNFWLYNLSLHGLGIMNFGSAQRSGEVWFLKRLARVTPRLVAIDVGANVGNYANLLKTLATEAILFAFEPHPQSFEQLQGQATVHNYTAINQGCSDFSGQFKLYDYAESTTGTQHASVYKNVIEQMHGGAAQAWDITVTTIDAFCDERKLQIIDLLKIDTEGHELSVLRGAAYSLARGAIGIIHFEFNAMNVVSRAFFRDFYECLPDYQFYRMLPDGLVQLGPYNPVLCEIFAYQNIVAIRNDYPGRQALLHR
jgi:FkbM family methyltransferase